MKKIVSIVTTAAILCTLTAGCANRTTSYRDGVNKGSTVGQNGVPSHRGTATGTGATYADGVYTANGDQTATGMQSATVYITKGKITDINLKSVDPQGRDMVYNVVPNNTTGGTNMGTGGTAGGTTDGTSGRITGGNVGTGTGAVTGGAAGAAIGGATGGPAGAAVGGATGAAVGGATGSAVGNSTSGTTTNNTGTAAGTGTSTTLAQARKDLTNAMIQKQTWDVNIKTNVDPTIINNWKLAVKRAIDKAQMQR
ncbi:hypothetical protein [Clostridium omnivorum]|uniref:Lipoprotein n=1 Tax=Clostridium omnivorum TaxID=1604902 RepID=A0ABQ5N8A4_9CLOT|nr:hypothetical protein [Clostridium sp. E14]GLC31482.1 hypothetical protein bsdE14_28920 [Clostridium sp. E14]